MTYRAPIAEDDLQAYVDDRLAPERRADVEAYLAEHPETAARLEGYREQRADLRAALAPLADAPIPPELNLARMIEDRHRATRRLWRGAASMAAALVLLVAGGAGGWLMRGASMPAQYGVAALAREAADSYVVYGLDHTHPVEFHANDRARLAAWIRRRIGLSIAIPDLSSAGYSFMGGRLVATSHGPAALFMYDDRHGARVVMLVRPMQRKDQNAPMKQYRDQRMASIAWADGGIGYSLTGAASANVLHPLADQARRQLGG